jgi:uncharacterized protein
VATNFPPFRSPGRPFSARLWELVGGTGLERFQLVRQPETWILQGTIIRLHERRPIEARYSVVCDLHWRTLNCDVALRDHDGERSVVAENQNGFWIVNGKQHPEIKGCIDIDLEWSPSTNSLPIRRLNLAEGAESELVNAAWIRFPELTLQRLPQTYFRLGSRRYRYSSGDDTFNAELLVDEHGIVEDYKGYWEHRSE